MANTVTYVLLAAMLVSILATIIAYFAIVEGVNRRRPEASRISYFSRDLARTFSAHRQLYPHSRLRQVMLVSMALEIALVFGFILRSFLGSQN